MYEVLACYPMDEAWIERDLIIQKVVGKSPCYRSSGCGSTECSGRDSYFKVSTLQKALELVKKLNRIPRVIVTIREH